MHRMRLYAPNAIQPPVPSMVMLARPIAVAEGHVKLQAQNVTSVTMYAIAVQGFGRGLVWVRFPLGCVPWAKKKHHRGRPRLHVTIRNQELRIRN